MLRLLLTLLALTLPARAQEAKTYARVEMAYADQSPQQKLDLYTPVEGSAPFPLVIWIHGGNWQTGDKSVMPFAVRGPVPTKPNERPFQIQVPDVDALTRMGFAVVSLNYRIGGTNIPEAALKGVRDTKTAVRYLRANAATLRIDPDRIAVWGNSAGGFNALMAGLTGDQATQLDDPANSGVSSAVQAVIVWYGAGPRFPPPLEIAPYLSAAKRLPPFMIATGELDPLDTPEKAAEVQDALVSHGATSTLTIVKAAGHEDPLFRQTQMQPAFAFLQQHLGR